jgi:hypothetical protein
MSDQTEDNDSQSSESSLSSESTLRCTFATPPVPPGTVPNPIDNDLQTPDLPFPRNDSPLPSPRKSPRVTVEDMALLFERLLRSQNVQTTLPAPKLSEVTPSAAVRQVPPSEYLQTSTAQSKSFSDLKFSNNVSTNRDTLKCRMQPTFPCR